MTRPSTGPLSEECLKTSWKKDLTHRLERVRKEGGGEEPLGGERATKYRSFPLPLPLNSFYISAYVQIM